MAEMDKQSKRRNKAVALGDALGKTLDPVLRKRGFASRDLLDRWDDVVPAPFNTNSAPEKLTWPRGERAAEGAVLHVRCADGHRLALQHEAPRVAAAINRYFGYVLVAELRLSIAPFTPGSAPVPQIDPQPTPETAQAVKQAVAEIENESLRAALQRLGLGVMGKHR